MGQRQSGGIPVPWNAIVGQMPPISKEDTTGWEYLYHIPIKAGNKHLVKSSKLGIFYIIGGACGYFTLDIGPYAIPNVTIDGHNYGTLFSTSEPGLRVTVQDNPGGEGSCLIVTRGGTSRPPLPIPIRAEVNQLVVQTNGSRDFRIIGNGVTLVHMGSGVVTVYGDLQSLYHGIMYHGDIVSHLVDNGGVIAENGDGAVIVEGNVVALLKQEGSGTVEVRGDVEGIILQIGCGNIYVRGKHGSPPVLKRGHGTVQIDG